MHSRRKSEVFTHVGSSCAPDQSLTCVCVCVCLCACETQSFVSGPRPCVFFSLFLIDYLALLYLGRSFCVVSIFVSLFLCPGKVSSLRSTYLFESLSRCANWEIKQSRWIVTVSSSVSLSLTPWLKTLCGPA